jgi:hypothetical protein
MKINMNINAVGETIEEAISLKLESNQLPGCFGYQSPTLLSNYLSGEAEDFIKIKYEVPESQRTDIDLKELLGETEIFNNKYVLTIEGKDKIEEHKNNLVKKYVDHIIKCNNCKVRITCSQFTTNYLLTVLLTNKNK